MLVFPYLTEPLGGPAPHSLAAGATERWRPLVPLSAIGPKGLVRQFGRALVDSGADDTVLPLAVVGRLGVALLPDTGHRIRWRGQPHPLRFGRVVLGLSDGQTTYEWPAVVAFSPAPIAYPLLGNAGCLEFFDVRFRGAARVVELVPNGSYPVSRP
jgi:hypothetical protein